MSKILSIIPVELHEDLIKEVQEVLKSREEKKESDKKKESVVSADMKQYLADKKKEREKIK